MPAGMLPTNSAAYAAATLGHSRGQAELLGPKMWSARRQGSECSTEMERAVSKRTSQEAHRQQAGCLWLCWQAHASWLPAQLGTLLAVRCSSHLEAPRRSSLQQRLHQLRLQPGHQLCQAGSLCSISTAVCQPCISVRRRCSPAWTLSTCLHQACAARPTSLVAGSLAALLPTAHLRCRQRLSSPARLQSAPAAGPQ